MTREIDVGCLAEEVVRELEGDSAPVIEALMSLRSLAANYHCTGNSFTCETTQGYDCISAVHSCSGDFSCRGKEFTSSYLTYKVALRSR